MLQTWKFSFSQTSERKAEESILRILIIRPGETTFDEQRCIQGNLDVRLTERGRDEVQKLADDLKKEMISQIYYAPCHSAQETARDIAQELRIPKKALEGLQNQNQGLWQGMRVNELQQRQPRNYRNWAASPEAIVPPGGESFQDVTHRVQKTIQWILKRHLSGAIGLVVCEPLASIVRCRLKCEEAKNLWNYIGLHGLWEPVEVHPSQLLVR
ncbi:MAG: histidine phosphatase family protein [Planctomycetia bacterium]|nr:histidine phosphatase family protein [Planctomycetia bacterium]